MQKPIKYAFFKAVPVKKCITPNITQKRGRERKPFSASFRIDGQRILFNLHSAPMAHVSHLSAAKSAIKDLLLRVF